MFEAFDRAARLANENYISRYDIAISHYWLDAARAYAEGGKSKEQVIAGFKQKFENLMDIIALQEE